MTVSAPVPIILEAMNGGYRCAVGDRVLDVVWPTPVEAWQDAIAALSEGATVHATILGYQPQACPPSVAWERARRRHGIRRLEPPALRLVTPADVAEAKRQAAERDAEDPRPKVVLRAGELARVTYDTLAALRDHADVFRRAGEIVEPVFTRRPWQTHDSAPALAVLAVPPTVLSVRASTSCRFVRETKNGGEAEADLAPKLAAVIAAEGARSDHLHVLSGMLECPALRPDGSIIRGKGYDTRTGYYLANDVELPGLADEPTPEDVKMAVEALQYLFTNDRDGKKGFAWKNGLKDAIVPIAMLLTALARPAIQPPKGCVPIFAFSASGKGSGKGTAVDIVFAILTGRTAPVLSWSGDEEEDDKRLGGVAKDAPPLCLIDNVPEDVPFGHSRLDAATTSDETAFRILGITGNPIFEWRTVLAVTGNNMGFIGDIGRRCLICYQCPDVEDPSAIPEHERVISHIVEHAMERREFYLACAFTILRGYFVAKCPDMGVELGTFTKWAKLVGNALKWAGLGTITDYLVGLDSTSEAPQKSAVRELAKHLHKMTENGNGVTAAYILDDLYSADYCDKKRRNQDMPPDVQRDPFRAAIETLCPFKGPPSNDAAFRLRFAKTLARHRGQWHAGHQIDQEINPTTGKAYDTPRWLARKKM